MNLEHTALGDCPRSDHRAVGARLRVLGPTCTRLSGLWTIGSARTGSTCCASCGSAACSGSSSSTCSRASAGGRCRRRLGLAAGTDRNAGRSKCNHCQRTLEITHSVEGDGKVSWAEPRFTQPTNLRSLHHSCQPIGDCSQYFRANSRICETGVPAGSPRFVLEKQMIGFRKVLQSHLPVP